jgi:hypothetical protein
MLYKVTGLIPDEVIGFFNWSKPSSRAMALGSTGNCFQRRMFPFLWVPELSPCLRYRLLTATAHKDRTAAVLQLTHSLANQLTPVH